MWGMPVEHINCPSFDSLVEFLFHFTKNNSTESVNKYTNVIIKKYIKVHLSGNAITHP